MEMRAKEGEYREGEGAKFGKRGTGQTIFRHLLAWEKKKGGT